MSSNHGLIRASTRGTTQDVEKHSHTLGLGPLSGVNIGRLSGVGAVWDCVPRVYGGGSGCAGGGVPLGAHPGLTCLFMALALKLETTTLHTLTVPLFV